MSKIISLDGDWQMIWDTEDTGISNRWYATYPEKTQTVSVPHIWERAFDKLLMAQDCAFYFKRFTIDDEKQVTKRIFLRFEKIATHATIWLNGKLLGDHFGAFAFLQARFWHYLFLALYFLQDFLYYFLHFLFEKKEFL